MKVKQFIGRKGNAVNNQFTIVGVEKGVTVEYFQSYNSIIVKKEYTSEGKVYLDEHYWNYSTTTSKYRNQFLNETTKEIKRKIKNGTYLLVDLNK